MAETAQKNVVTAKTMPPVTNIPDIASWDVCQALLTACVYKLVSG